MGSVPNQELKSVYQGADYLVNLSVHNDEDFGMSVAEAQCSGLPSILTAWGGLASFKHPDLPEATRFVPVRIGKKNKVLLYPKIIEFMEESLKSRFNEREELSQLAINRFGIEAAHKILESILKKTPREFNSFSETFHEALHHTNFSHTPYLTPAREINQLYRKLYSSYV